MQMPPIERAFGVLPLRYATLLISLIGLGIGALGIFVIVLYGVAENSIMSHFSKSSFNEDIKKLVLAFMGFSSLLLLIANAMLLLGSLSNNGANVAVGYMTLLIMCVLQMLVFVLLPVSCFFIAGSCIIKKVSTVVTTLAILAITGFLEFWIYAVVVAWNYEQSI